MSRERRVRTVAAVLGLGLLLWATAVQAASRWTTTDGYWTNAAIWDGGASVPQAGDDVSVDNAVTLDESTPALNSCTNNATLTFMGTNTVLHAVDVTVNGAITHPAQADSDAPWVIEHRVWIDCSNLTVNASKSINVNGKGYSGGIENTHPFGYGPGAGEPDAGGGHGGVGGYRVSNDPGGGTYGDIDAPVDAGSGGGNSSGRYGGDGGGVVRIVASGNVRVDGSIAANGLPGSSWGPGGGAGGSVYITCDTLAGAGSVTANGADGDGNAGGGAGGRIAVDFNTTAQAGVGIQPTVTLSSKPGHFADVEPRLADPGTLWLSGTNFFPSTTLHASGVIAIPGFTSWPISGLTIDSAWVQLPTGLVITVAGDATVDGAGASRLVLGEYTRLMVGGNLIVTNGADLYVQAGVTNGGSWPAYGALVAVTNRMSIDAGSWVVPVSDGANGGSVKFEVGDLSVSAGGGFNANSRGYDRGVPVNGDGKGPGGGQGSNRAGGGGYGGAGGSGDASGPGGQTYGDALAPVEPGSGGGAQTAGRYGGYGGGLIWVEAAGAVTLSGTLTVNGGSSTGDWGCGGGSGGGIYLWCISFAGSNGVLSAVGGNGHSDGGGGGGGRIAVARAYDTSSGISTNVAGGTGYNPGGTGTVVWRDLGPTITNVTATNITETAAWIVGDLVSTGEAPCEVFTYWGQSDEGETKSAWDTNAHVGSFPVGAVSNSLSDLAVGTLYHYRFYASNVYGDAWSPNPQSFSTVGGLGVDNDGGATDIGQTAATLNGNVTAGNPVPSAYIAWGDNDAGDTATSAWNRVGFGGTLLGPYVVAVSNLLANETYHYRAYVTNDGGEAWAAATTNFTTLSPVLTIDDIEVIEGNGVSTTDAVFTVTLSAQSAEPVTVEFSAADGTAVSAPDYFATNGTLTVPAGAMSGTITVRVRGDDTDEFPSETLYVNLSNATMAVIGDVQGRCVIQDDDDVADTRTWTGSGNWNSDSNWAPWGRPSPADDVIVESGTVALTGDVAVTSVAVSNGAVLKFSAWQATLTATDIEVGDGALVTHELNTDTTSGDGWTPNACVSIVCTDLTVVAGASISANGQGYQGNPGVAAPWTGYGPGGGDNTVGGGYGGRGAVGLNNGFGGGTYGSAAAPVGPGSGGGSGGSSGRVGGDGGGAIRIAAGGHVIIDGTVSADGNDGSQWGAGGGSGGAIHITCNTFAGTGRISADGGNAGTDTGGGGGGGRIAIIYNATAQAGVSPAPSPVLSAAPGEFDNYVGEPGTVYLSDAGFYPYETLPDSVHIVIPGFTSWSPSVVTIDTAYVWLPTGLTVQVGGDLVVSGGQSTRLVVDEHSTLRAGDDLTLAGGADLYVYAGATNGGTWLEYGTRVAAGGTMGLSAGSWVYPVSDNFNGGSVKFEPHHLTVVSGAGFAADAAGFEGGIAHLEDGWGPGAGKGSGRSGGAGYGGQGADGDAGTGGPTYGDEQAPTMPGSGGGANTSGRPGGDGGGLIWIASSGTVTIDGTLHADGTAGSVWGAGGGAGGGIYVSCRTFAGTTGVLRADGGDGAGTTGPGGGGGRIAVWYGKNASAGITTSVGGGTGYATGDTGTVYWGVIPSAGTVVILR